MAVIEIPGPGTGVMTSGGLVPYLDKTLAQLEALVPVLGDIGFPTDSVYELHCIVAGTWTYLVQGQACTPPPSAGWTAYGTATVSMSGGARLMTMPNQAGVSNSNFHGEHRAEFADPTVTPYYAEFGIVPLAWGGGGVASTGCWGGGQSNGTAMSILRFGSNELVHANYSNSTTYVGPANAAVTGRPAIGLAPVFIRVEEDGANRRVFIKNNLTGIYKQLGADIARTLVYTPDKVWWGGNSLDTELELSALLVHYAEGAV